MRKNAFASECPKSFITEQSRYYLEQFYAWKRLGFVSADISAKTADALAMLNQLWFEETESGKQE